MFKRIWKICLLIYAMYWAFLPLNSAQAQTLYDTGAGIGQMIASQESGLTVRELGLNISAGAGMDLDFFAGSIFTPIIPKWGANRNWPFYKGEVLNFSLRNKFGPIFSITGPRDYVNENFEQEITGGIPSPNATYFNTLNIDWDGSKFSGGLIAAVGVLDDGHQFDGVASGQIPISALLFGTGLIGLVGIARRSLFSE